ncbi:unnamed protein product [Effrenium voratum]|nr:unnamed protein product [Effrenium voratum]
MTGDAASRALREAQLFRKTCLHLRRQQRQRLLSEALRASTAEANEAALVFAQDRVDFALQQATLLAKELPPDSPLRHWDASLWSQEAQRSQRLLLRRRQLRQELDQQWSQAQLALNRLRALQSLATMSIEPAGADEPKARGQLLALLQSCEQTLLKGTSQCDLAAEMADTEGSDVFLESVVPVLHGKTQGAVPEKRASSASAEEEVRLRLMLQDLSDHNEKPCAVSCNSAGRQACPTAAASPRPTPSLSITRSTCTWTRPRTRRRLRRRCVKARSFGKPWRWSMSSWPGGSRTKTPRPARCWHAWRVPQALRWSGAGGQRVASLLPERSEPGPIGNQNEARLLFKGSKTRL